VIGAVDGPEERLQLAAALGDRPGIEGIHMHDLPRNLAAREQGMPARIGAQCDRPGRVGHDGCHFSRQERALHGVLGHRDRRHIGQGQTGLVQRACQHVVAQGRDLHAHPAAPQLGHAADGPWREQEIRPFGHCDHPHGAQIAQARIAGHQHLDQRGGQSVEFSLLERALRIREIFKLHQPDIHAGVTEKTGFLGHHRQLARREHADADRQRALWWCAAARKQCGTQGEPLAPGRALADGDRLRR